MNRTLLAVSGCSLLGILSASCSKSDRAEFGPERRIPQGQRPTKFGASTDERLGTAATSDFTADTPPGWSPLPSKKFRDLNYQVAGNPDAECYLSASGINGTVEMNLNRWLEQFGLAPGSVPIGKPDQVLMGQPAVLVSLDGTYLKNKQGWALLGLIAQSADGSGLITLKMTGPKDVVQQQREAFLKLAKSIKSGGGGQGGMNSGPDMGPAPGGAGSGANPHGGAGPGPNPHGGEGNGVPHATTVPASWRAVENSGMRVLDHRFGTAGECYIVILGGAAGGVGPNVDRWCDEMKKPHLKPAELAALPRRPVLGSPSTFVEIHGSFASKMSGKEVADAILLAAIVPLESQTLFVKMIGPAAEVDAQRKAFEDFCSGLKW